MKTYLLSFLFIILALAQASAYKKQSIDIMVDGKSRNMVVFTPDVLPDNAPLFIVTHGMNQDPEYQYGSDKMYEMIDTAKFVITYLRSDGNTWDTGGTKDQNFVIKTIDEMAARFSIDTNRVYWSGFSMGSMLIHHCIANMQNKIAAFAPTSGIQFSEQPWNNCKKPVNMIECIAYDDDVFGYEQYGIHAYIENYAKHDGHTIYKKTANYKPISTSWYNGDLERWTGGPNGGEVMLYSYHNGGHWPMDLNRHLIWAFCKRFSLDPNIPNCKIISPQTDDKFTTLDSISIKFSANDNDGTIKQIKLTIDGVSKLNLLSLAVKDTTITYVYKNFRAGSHTIKLTVTDNDKKTKEASRIITVDNPTPLNVLSATPENESFDIPSDYRTYQYVFDMKVNCDDIVAYLYNTKRTIYCDVNETGMSDTVTVTVPDSIELGEERFTFYLTKVVDERGVKAPSFKYYYQYGESETTTYAVKYKQPFKEMLNVAQELLKSTSDSIYACTEKLRTPLQDTINKYVDLKTISPSVYVAATETLKKAIEPLSTRKNNLDAYYAICASADMLLNGFAENQMFNTTTAYTQLDKYRKYYTLNDYKLGIDTQITSATSKLQTQVDKFRTAVMNIGDINKDGVIDSQDILLIYDFMQNSTADTPTADKDANKDGQVDSQDVLVIYNIIMCN